MAFMEIEGEWAGVCYYGCSELPCFLPFLASTKLRNLVCSLNPYWIGNWISNLAVYLKGALRQLVFFQPFY